MAPMLKSMIKDQHKRSVLSDEQQEFALFLLTSELKVQFLLIA